ncbi:MAG: NYN domain-containing protein [candidate division WOR-3 bacterium]
MANPRVIVDGYNLIHALPELVRLVDADMARARDRLVAYLSEFVARRNVEVTVVFDGRGPQFAPHNSSRVAGVEIVFSRPPHDADQTIIALLQRNTRPRSVTIVTSDASVARSARDYGAKTISSHAFVRLLAALDGRGPSGREQEGLSDKPEMTPGDLAEWEEYMKSRGVDTTRGWF